MHLPPSGATQCSLSMELLGTTRKTSWIDGSPPPGVKYRVGVAANWINDQTGGDVAVLSPAVKDAP